MSTVSVASSALVMAKLWGALLQQGRYLTVMTVVFCCCTHDCRLRLIHAALLRLQPLLLCQAPTATRNTAAAAPHTSSHTRGPGTLTSQQAD